MTTAEFMSASPAPMRGNTSFASRYAAELRSIVTRHANLAPRSVQQYLGPSELGSDCDRQVAGKMAQQPTTNHVVDPWPSILGTAFHAWAADCFTAENYRLGVRRFLAEQKVTAHPDHPGTADLYDAQYAAVVDHKCLGRTSMEKVSSPGGPPRRYVVQLLLYGQGYRNLGLDVERVMLAAYPRTASTLAGIYVWEREYTSADDKLVEEVFAETQRRRAYAEAIVRGEATLMDVPMTPDDTECYFCPFYRSEAAWDGQAGCPGAVGMRNHALPPIR